MAVIAQVVAAVLGAVCIVAAVAVLAGAPWALGTAGVFLIMAAAAAPYVEAS
jgi:hypothetical protein